MVVTEPMAKKGIRAGHQNLIVDVAMVECAHVFGMIVDRAKPERCCVFEDFLARVNNIDCAYVGWPAYSMQCQWSAIIIIIPFSQGVRSPRRFINSRHL